MSSSGKDVGSFKVFVGGLSVNCDDRDLREYLLRFGPVYAVDIVRDKHGQSKGYAFAAFRSAEDRGKAIGKSHTLLGRPFEIRPLVDSQKNSEMLKENAKRKLFVSNLKDSFEERDLISLFSQYGTVSEVTVSRDASTQLSKGFGFIVFTDESSVQAVLNNAHKRTFKIKGHEIIVKEAIPKREIAKNKHDDKSRKQPRPAPSPSIPVEMGDYFGYPLEYLSAILEGSMHGGKAAASLGGSTLTGGNNSQDEETRFIPIIKGNEHQDMVECPALSDRRTDSWDSEGSSRLIPTGGNRVKALKKGDHSSKPLRKESANFDIRVDGGWRPLGQSKVRSELPSLQTSPVLHPDHRSHQNIHALQSTSCARCQLKCRDEGPTRATLFGRLSPQDLCSCSKSAGTSYLNRYLCHTWEAAMPAKSEVSPHRAGSEAITVPSISCPDFSFDPASLHLFV